MHGDIKVGLCCNIRFHILAKLHTRDCKSTIRENVMVLLKYRKSHYVPSETVCGKLMSP